ncbi:MAG: NUDIX domain-containing protein [Bacillota bacterium]
MQFCPQCGGRLALQFVPRDQKERLVCQDCAFIFYQDPKVSACTIPLIDGKVVLARRAIEPARGCWVFPGGYMERGETVAEAAERETLEEVNLRVRVTHPVGIYSYPTSIVVVIVFHCEVVGGELAVGSETLEVRTFDFDEIPWDELAFSSTRDGLRDFVRQHRGE